MKGMMTGHEYRDLVAEYVFRHFSGAGAGAGAGADADAGAGAGLDIYTEVHLGKTIIGKDRKVDVFVVARDRNQALAIECKYQGAQGTTDEKIPYALQDLAAMRVASILVYAGEGWSRGILHTLEASPLAAYCLPVRPGLERHRGTRELDHVVAATFGLWDRIIPARRRFQPPLTLHPPSVAPPQNGQRAET